MGLRLRLTSLLPAWAMRAELARVARETTGALDALLEEHAPQELARIRLAEGPVGGGMRALRAAMAVAHRVRVAALVDALGHDEAICRGRRVLRPVGRSLGAEMRARLGVGDTAGDLALAARVLYRLMGIHFCFRADTDGGRLEVYRCALAEHYAETTCRVLNAVDEGVVQGLCPRARMRFLARLTGGCPRCIARVDLDASGT